MSSLATCVSYSFYWKCYICFFGSIFEFLSSCDEHARNSGISEFIVVPTCQDGWARTAAAHDLSWQGKDMPLRKSFNCPSLLPPSCRKPHCYLKFPNCSRLMSIPWIQRLLPGTPAIRSRSVTWLPIRPLSKDRQHGQKGHTFWKVRLSSLNLRNRMISTRNRWLMRYWMFWFVWFFPWPDANLCDAILHYAWIDCAIREGSVSSSEREGARTGIATGGLRYWENNWTCQETSFYLRGKRDPKVCIFDFFRFSIMFVFCHRLGTESVLRSPPLPSRL